MEPHKSPNDRRSYRYFTLDNGICVVVISDPVTEKAAAACDVGVGSWSDPPEVLGVAHLLGT